MLSLGQLISWGLVYYTFPLFVVPMTQELGWSRSAMFGALSAGLLVAGLCSIPVGAWIDRGHGRMLMTGGSLLAAALLLVWSKVDSLPLFYALWIGLGACQAVILYEPAFAVITRVYGPRYKQAILLMTFLGGLASTFGIPVRPAPDRAHRLAADARGAGRDQPRRRPPDPLAVHSRPARKARADRRGQATGRRA